MPDQLPELPPPPPEGGDELAQEEASALANDDLEQRAKEADHGRAERLKDHLSTAAIIVFWVAVALFGLALIILTWHVLAPDKWCWLSTDSVGQLKALIGGIVLSGGAQSYAKKYIK